MSDNLNNIFIPKKIKVGYNERKETYTGKLGYIIYQDNKGVWRKEKSWTSWKDDKIPVDEFDNSPQDGLCLNKDVQRYNWSHFGSNRSYIRVYDPRGFEFEITPENLIGILTETDCLKRGLDGKFVYAWEGTNLILLPCGSETYQKAQEHTDRQDKNVLAKDLKPGYAYTNKKGETVVYLGKHKWVEWDSKNWQHRKRIEVMAHVFAHPEKPKWGSQFFRKKDVTFLSSLASSSEVMEYPDLLNGFTSTINSSPIVGFEYSPEPTKFSEDMNKKLSSSDPNAYLQLRHTVRFLNGDILTFGTITVWGYVEKLVKNQLTPNSFHGTGISYVPEYTFDTKTMEGRYITQVSKNITMKDADNLASTSLSVQGVLSNGKKIEISDYNSIFK